MNRYMAKLNAEHLHGNDPARWESQFVEIQRSTPRRVSNPNRSGLPQVSVGDELWICTDASGPGIAALATAKSIEEREGALLVQLHRVNVIEKPIALDAFPRLMSGSKLFGQLQRNRHEELYFLDEEVFAEFKNIVMSRLGPRSMPQEVSWDEVISRNHNDARKQLETELKVPLALRPVRHGQRSFREALLRLYEGRCVITGCGVSCAVEAAHIVPWTGDPDLDRPENGLLLRRDLHGLFDAGLLGIDPTSGKVFVAGSLIGTEYEAYDGVIVNHYAAPELLSERSKLLDAIGLPISG